MPSGAVQATAFKHAACTSKPRQSAGKALSACLHTPLKGYQRLAVEQALTHSTKVVLPTGSGKTLIAAATAAATANANRDAKVLFLVPSRQLEDQQSHEERNETDLAVARYMGGMSAPAPQHHSVNVALPAAFTNLSATDKRFALSSYVLIIFDEVCAHLHAARLL